MSDVVVLTSDNPRTEDPAAILREVEVGVKEALAERTHVQYQMILIVALPLRRRFRRRNPGTWY